MLTRLFALIATLFASSAVRAAEPLQPTGKWIVNFDEAQCVAFRNYGSKERPIYLTLKAPPLGSVMQVSVIRTGPRLDPEQSDVRLTFGEQKVIRTTLLSFRDKAALQAHMLNLPAVHVPLLSQEATLSIQSGSRLNHHFALSQMAPLLKIMDKCVTDLRNYWNIDEQLNSFVEQTGVRTASDRRLSGLFNSEDYPADAAFDGDQGSATFVVLVGLDGKVADCSITETSGVAALDSQSCGIIRKRARFKPAIGSDGKPARSGFRQQVSWRLQ